MCSRYRGGWMQKKEIKGETPSIPGFIVKKPYNQYIKMDELVNKIR